ncbi:MAG TPA: carboxypeptidase-like regulatory domain-containing protein [Gemmatimonadaceae bacterium]
MRARPTLILLGGLILLPARSFDAQTTQPQPSRLLTIDGVVRDAGKAPVPSAELSIWRVGESRRVSRTDSDGKFTFSDLAPGPLSLTVRRLGYKAISLKLDVTAATAASPVEIQLEEIASDIDDVIVEAGQDRIREFYAHKATNNFGKFFERKDINRLARQYASEVLRVVPGARLEASERNGNHVLLRGCKPIVWIDGMRAANAEVDDLARPSDLEGMEVYPSWAGLPAQYQDRDNRMCGVILLWTRSQ